MGQAFPQAVTAKESGDGNVHTKGLEWGYSCMQGWRVSMEDAHFVLPGLGKDTPWMDTAAFGVMDGHGGQQVARFCEMYLPIEISQGPHEDPCGALVDAFHRMDELLTENEPIPDGSPLWIGCTANVCLVRPDKIVVANTGDSRAVLSRAGRAVPLSEDHKPNNPRERQRIENAGGTVERFQYGPHVQYRVNGNLNLSRSIGDLQYKRNVTLQPSEQMICATPDVRTFPRDIQDEFMIIACDGIWDMIGCQDAVDFIRERLEHRSSLSSIAEELLDHCVSPDLSKTSGLGGDNMTAIIVKFDPRHQMQASYSPKLVNSRSPSFVSSPPVVHDGNSTDNSSYVDDKVIEPSGLCRCKIAQDAQSSNV